MVGEQGMISVMSWCKIDDLKLKQTLKSVSSSLKGQLHREKTTSILSPLWEQSPGSYFWSNWGKSNQILMLC